MFYLMLKSLLRSHKMAVTNSFEFQSFMVLGSFMLKEFTSIRYEISSFKKRYGVSRFQIWFFLYPICVNLFRKLVVKVNTTSCTPKRVHLLSLNNKKWMICWNLVKVMIGSMWEDHGHGRITKSSLKWRRKWSINQRNSENCAWKMNLNLKINCCCDTQ